MFSRGLLSTLPFLILLGGLAATAPRAAVVINEDNTTPNSIPAVATFDTTGALMGGMAVTATFSGGLIETIAWAPTGGDSGGVFGAGWSLSQSGDTFGLTNPWTFSFTGPAGVLGQLVSLELDGAPGLTLFDRTFGGVFGTDGSAQGRDFEYFGLPEFDVTVTYANPVGIGAALPVGDIFHRLALDFGQGGPREGSFAFLQDTDNDARRVDVPEPAMLGLLGLALIGFGVVRLRRLA
jgi:hypothetical protein